MVFIYKGVRNIEKNIESVYLEYQFYTFFEINSLPYMIGF